MDKIFTVLATLFFGSLIIAAAIMTIIDMFF